MRVELLASPRQSPRPGATRVARRAVVSAFGDAPSLGDLTVHRLGQRAFPVQDVADVFPGCHRGRALLRGQGPALPSALARPWKA
jgi:hypothetical protein